MEYYLPARDTPQAKIGAVCVHENALHIQKPFLRRRRGSPTVGVRRRPLPCLKTPCLCSDKRGDKTPIDGCTKRCVTVMCAKKCNSGVCAPRRYGCSVCHEMQTVSMYEDVFDSDISREGRQQHLPKGAECMYQEVRHQVCSKGNRRQ